MKQYIPNALTMLRLFLAGAFPIVPPSWRIPIFVVSAITEFSDGFLSRRWGVASESGKLLDPIADKAFVFAVIATLFFEGVVEPWWLIAVGIRDLVVAGGSAWVWLFRDRSEFERARPRLLGKLTTNFQFLFLFAALIWGTVPIALVVATSLLSLSAAIDYVAFYLREVRIRASD